MQEYIFSQFIMGRFWDVGGGGNNLGAFRVIPFGSTHGFGWANCPVFSQRFGGSDGWRNLWPVSPPLLFWFIQQHGRSFLSKIL